MDADFEQHYQAAERAYGLGEYTEAHALTSALWDQLQSASDEHDRSLVLGWRAVVSLLQGHIQLHGFQRPDQASLSYQRVLDCEPEATIEAIAEQGLERCRAENTANAATTAPATDGAIPDLLKDPFLTRDPDPARPAPAHVVTAMPWLNLNEEPTQDNLEDIATSTSPETTLTQEANSDVLMAILEPDPADPTPEEPTQDNLEDIATSTSPETTLTQEANSDVLMAILEPDPADPTPEEPAAKDLLEHSWLRVQLQPEIKSPTDSMEPMGLMKKIKGVFSRSAGR